MILGEDLSPKSLNLISGKDAVKHDRVFVKNVFHVYRLMADKSAKYDMTKNKLELNFEKKIVQTNIVVKK